MNSFETFLIKKGYTKYIFNTKKMALEKTTSHVISTIENLDHRYIKKNIQILFGLNEKNKPQTLIYPRPLISIKRVIEGKIVIHNQNQDDAMNIVLNKTPNEQIYEAMFNHKKIIKIDLT